MRIIPDRFGRKIRLTDERWNYIVHKRPIMEGLRTEFEYTIKGPELVKSSVYDSEVVLYYRYFKELFNGKYIVAVVKIGGDNFVVTGYVTGRVKKGDVVWKKG
jgi:hypothetical protein